VLISAAEELRTLEYGQRLRDRRRARLASVGQSVGAALYEAALAGGRQAAGLAGDAVDLDRIILNGRDPIFAGATDADRLDRALFTAPILPIREVWRGDQRLVAEGRHVCRDAIEAGYRAAMAPV
jgi:formimidoylglutamate deiminase